MKLEPFVKAKITNHLTFLYADNRDASFLQRFFDLLEQQKETTQPRAHRWDEKDVILITYGDSIITKNEAPLDTLYQFCHQYLNDVISIVHILPFFPYSSDDGFSVIDYTQVNPELGDWSHIDKIRENFDVMFDLVINHMSQQSEWFQNYLKGDSPGADFFIEADPTVDLSNVIRPRSLPLLSSYQTNRGKKFLWTTFSKDQVDLNFKNPEVLLEMMRMLLLYLQHGARIIRLDAIAFLWKEIGTTCLHLPQTHAVVKLMRVVMESVDPHSIVLTETNVPNEENLSYFGQHDEAHMVYQFSLPPLLLHALFAGNPTYLTQWAQTIPDHSPHETYFNFTASHDGIGLRPLEGLLPEPEKAELLQKMKEFGGRISVKNNADGSTSPYEINITYFDALQGTRDGIDDFQIDRFLCSQTIMMTLQGIPAFYVHSVLGTENDVDGVKQTGRARSINRKKWHRDDLVDVLKTETHHKIILRELSRRIKIRKGHPAFSPDALQKIKSGGRAFFVVERQTRCGHEKILSVSNMTAQPQAWTLNERFKIDLLTHERVANNSITLQPYQTMWLTNT